LNIESAAGFEREATFQDLGSNAYAYSSSPLVDHPSNFAYNNNFASRLPSLFFLLQDASGIRL
jgi:hypothetical protein